MARDLLAAPPGKRPPRDLLAGPGVIKLGGTVAPMAPELRGQRSANVVNATGESAYSEPEAMKPDLIGATAATISGFINGIPVLGPLAQKATDNITAVGAQLTGGDYGETMQSLEDRRRQIAEANPIAAGAGEIAGTVSSLGAGAATKIGAEALGLAGKLVPRVVNSAASSGGLSLADSVARGNDPGETLAKGGVDAAIGAAFPLIGDAVSTGVKAVGRMVAPTINAMRKPVDEAARRLGVAVQRDAKANPDQLLTSADEVVAREAGVPLMNVDRGGETTRALARSVANQSPEARAVIEKKAAERFQSQGGRAVEFVKRITGGKVDDLAYQRSVKEAAAKTNDPAYKAAMNSPKAQQVFTPELQELMQSPTIQNAITAVKSRGADRAAVAGDLPIMNPFRQGSDGVWRVARRPDGSTATPNLAFWDQVKRNLDSSIGRETRAGDNEMVGDLMGLKRKLVGALDNLVPEYQTARRGAAAFFDAEDALEAGKKFAGTPKLIPEAREAFEKFSGAERQAFATGYASELIDKIKTVRDRVNVINSVFGTPASREMIELVLGSSNAKRLEAFVRVEDLADKIRGALGNSTTARQLKELGIGMGVGGLTGLGISGGDWGAAAQGVAVGAGAKGAHYLGQQANDRVLQEIGRMLISDDPAMLQKAVARATMDSSAMKALKQLGDMLGVGERGLLAAPDEPTGTQSTAARLPVPA